MKNIIVLLSLIAVAALATFSCTKEILEIPDSDIGVKLSADDFQYFNGDTITLTAVISNYGEDDATDIEILLKRRNTALKIISSDNANYVLGSGVLSIDTLRVNELVTLKVKAIGTILPSIPAVHITQDVSVLKNINYDGNAENNIAFVSISLRP